jgi:hypothetical protein
VGEFDEVVHNSGSVIAKVNSKFGTDFATFVHTEDNVANVFSDVDAVHREIGETAEQIARPTENKNKLKIIIKQRFESAEIALLTKEAQSCYIRFITG